MRHKKLMTQAQAAELRAQMSRGQNPHLAPIIERNIELIELLRQEADQARSRQDRAADWITDFSGSMSFLYLHIAWFGIWVVMNGNVVPGLKPFDPFPFGLLTMVVSLEAIFLSTFVLISQNRDAAENDEREALDLQIDLLAEYEITRMLRLVDKMAEKMEIQDAYDKEIDQLCEPVAPDLVLKEIAKKRKSNEVAEKAKT